MPLKYRRKGKNMSKRIEIDYESLQLAVKNKMLAKDMAKQFNCSKQTILKNLIEQGLYDDFLNYKRIPYSEYVKCDVCGKEIPWEKKMTRIINGERCFLCGKHYMQYHAYSCFKDSIPDTCFDTNKYEIIDDGVWIYTTDRYHQINGRFLIDIDDLDRVLAYKWRKWDEFYVTGNVDIIQINRFILNPPDDMVVDHQDGDRTNNRKSNLRIVTQAQNCQNKALLSTNHSEIMGVWFDKKRNKWSAEIKMNGIKCYLGRYNEKCDAVYARYSAEIKLFGEYRSFRNDESITNLSNQCQSKEIISDYVNKRIQTKFKIEKECGYAKDNS